MREASVAAVCGTKSHQRAPFHNHGTRVQYHAVQIVDNASVGKESYGFDGGDGEGVLLPQPHPFRALVPMTSNISMRSRRFFFFVLRLLPLSLDSKEKKMGSSR